MKSSLRIVYSLIVFILGIVLLAVLTVLLIYENHQTHLSFSQVTQSHVVKQSLQQVLSALVEAESAQRGYLLTKNRMDLHATRDLGSVDTYLSRIDSLVGSDATQKAEAQKLRQYSLSLSMELRSLFDTTSERAGTTSQPQVSSHERLLGEIREIIIRMQSREDERLARKQEDVRRHSVLPAIIGIGISIFAMLIFIVAFYFTNAELKKSIHLNAELETKNIQLEKYTQELSSFTNISTHDMQEPLRKIELFISMIEEREKQSMSPRAIQHFQKIKESVARMRQLFFSILSFSLADQVRNIKDTVDLNEVMSETLESFKVYIKDSNAIVNYDRLPKVTGVKHQLVQVFQNLVSNSLKYKRHEVIPEINITCNTVEGKHLPIRELSRDATYFRIDFEDNGVGFDEKYVDKIFDIFQRHVSNGTNGPGVGLAICRKIAQNHSGTITAESEINKGSVFSLYLPAQ
jgi:signal transduction histidine kinase